MTKLIKSQRIDMLRENYSVGGDYDVAEWLVVLSEYSLCAQVSALQIQREHVYPLRAISHSLERIADTLEMR